jgi:hypothetical protein
MTSYNLLPIEFHQWHALWRDLRTARSAGELFGYLLKPPGWRPDGAGETTEDLRREAARVRGADGTRDAQDSASARAGAVTSGGANPGLSGLSG